MKTKPEHQKSPFDRGGRKPTIYSEPLKRQTIQLTKEMHKWLKSQPGGMSKAFRAMIEKAMNNER